MNPNDQNQPYNDPYTPGTDQGGLDPYQPGSSQQVPEDTGQTFQAPGAEQAARLARMKLNQAYHQQPSAQPTPSSYPDPYQQTTYQAPVDPYQQPQPEYQTPTYDYPPYQEYQQEQVMQDQMEPQYQHVAPDHQLPPDQHQEPYSPYQQIQPQYQQIPPSYDYPPYQEYQQEQVIQDQIEPQYQHVSPQYQLENSPYEHQLEQPLGYREGLDSLSADNPGAVPPPPPATPDFMAPKPIENRQAKEVYVSSSEPLHTITLPKRTKPILKSLAAAGIGMLLYISPVIAGQIQYYTSPGDTFDAPVITDPEVAVKVSPEPKLIIPKINSEAPVVYGITSYDEGEIQAGLEKGVVHYGKTALPGQIGNNVILGHNSNNFWYAGNFKTALALLDRMEKGDTFVLHYEGTRYIYEIYDKKTVKPDDFSVVFDVPEAKTEPITTLITCFPPGSSWNRLVVHARQISPDPSQAEQAEPLEKPQDINGSVPANNRRFWEVVVDWIT